MLIRVARDEDSAAVVALWTEAYSGRHPEGRQAIYLEAEFSLAPPFSVFSSFLARSCT